ncbi:MAG: hypothetical protein ACHQZQ_03080 [SAR324 cluster bacterium]
MRVNFPFDTLTIVQRLRNAGFEPKQAEVLVEALADLVYGQVATKQELELLETRLRAHIANEFGTQLRWIIGVGITLALASVGGNFALFKFFLLPGLR